VERSRTLVAIGLVEVAPDCKSMVRPRGPSTGLELEDMEIGVRENQDDRFEDGTVTGAGSALDFSLFVSLCVPCSSTELALVPTGDEERLRTVSEVGAKFSELDMFGSSAAAEVFDLGESGKVGVDSDTGGSSVLGWD
jgi:hypothetical protein